MSRPLHPLAGRVLLLLGSTLFSLLLVEGVFRLVMPPATHHLMYRPANDPEIGITLRPDSRFEFEGVPVRIPATTVQISAQGLRNPEVTIPKPPGSKRLLCVGDSTSFGWGVERQETFCHLLSQKLGSPWETVNLGVPGYNPAQEVALFAKRGLPMQPDAVILLLQSNDYEPPLAFSEQTSVSAWFVRNSALLRWIRVQLARSGGPAATDAPAPVLQAFDRLIELRAAHGFALLVLFPTPDSFPDIAQRLDAASVPRADIQAALADRDRLTIPGDGHPNAAGHAALAAFIHDQLAPLLRTQVDAAPAP